MADGSLKITPAEARARADELKKIFEALALLL